MSDFVFIHLPQGLDLRLARRYANRLTGKELLDLCWKEVVSFLFNIFKLDSSETRG